MGDKALVLFSGGQDSTVCLAWALERYDHVETVGFDYGQRHRVELECRTKIRSRIKGEFPKWSDKLGPDHMLDLGVLQQLGETALTKEVEIKTLENGLPSTFVPGRNLLFFTLAAALASRRGIRRLVGGMCETDYSGYPDCRDDTLKALQATLNLGMQTNCVIETPLMWVDKAGTWKMAEQIGGKSLFELVRMDTHTCYKGDHQSVHDWGYGCGQCPACELRLSGFQRYNALEHH
jgi:7-cyano-7-deazaguanine synthase